MVAQEILYYLLHELLDKLHFTTPSYEKIASIDKPGYLARVKVIKVVNDDKTVLAISTCARIRYYARKYKRSV